jgi:hypothetical protein
MAKPVAATPLTMGIVEGLLAPALLSPPLLPQAASIAARAALESVPAITLKLIRMYELLD